VSCSDKEVNIKILLNGIVAAGDLTLKQRNELLGEMTDEVAAIVLRDNFVQTRAISFTASQSLRLLDLHTRYLDEMDRSGKINRAIEFLPDDKVLAERKLSGLGLTRPEIAVLLCYSKTILKEQILASEVPEDPHFKTTLINSFPKPLQKRFKQEMENHPLKREIIATKLSNIVINEMVFSFVYRMQEEVGSCVAEIVRAYMLAREVLNIESIWKQLEEIESIITAEEQTELVVTYIRLLRRVTRWFLRTQRAGLNVSKLVKLYGPGVIELKKSIPSVLGETKRVQFEERYNDYLKQGIPPALAHEITVTRGLFSAMDIIEVAHQHQISVNSVAEVYFGMGEYLDLAWIRTQIISHPTDNNWEILSRESLRDDLDWQQRQLTAGIIALDNNNNDYMKCFSEWSDNHASLIERWRHILTDLKSATVLTYTMFFVAVRELHDLTQTTLQMSKQEVTA